MSGLDVVAEGRHSWVRTAWPAGPRFWHGGHIRRFGTGWGRIGEANLALAEEAMAGNDCDLAWPLMLEAAEALPPVSSRRPYSTPATP
jgi:hypothetical protein